VNFPRIFQSNTDEKTGGFGRVFAARHVSSNDKVVIKQMARTPSKSLEPMARREFEIGMRLKHRNIVRMRGSFDTDRDHCIVMNCVKGDNLFDYFCDNDFAAFEEARARKMFRGLAKGESASLKV
jgi:serine/threonine protein kinase